MGTYVNPGNEGFATILRSEYVDKTALIGEFDKTLDSSDKLVLVSRPRRFGKSYAAKMLVAYYSCGCDSASLFEGLEIAESGGFEEHLNKFNVISLDMTEIIQAHGVSNVVPAISRLLLPELRELVPHAGERHAREGIELKTALIDVVRATGRKFVFVIDEWDAPNRLAEGDRAAQDAYADLLRALFKGLTFTDLAIAGAYLTGILPMRKYAHQSAVSDFREFTMVLPGPYASYVGFTQSEVEALCERHGLDVDDVAYWYDGYELEGAGSVYAPFSVMRACSLGKTGSYWVTTEAYESLRPYIEMDFDGLQGDLVRAIAGAPLNVDPAYFRNDITSIVVKDDVLTLLVHLGYLSYNESDGTARVPNEEVRVELARAVAGSSHPKLAALMRESVALLDDVANMREDAVAAGIQRVHDRNCAPLFCNNEQALRSVVKTALVAAVDDYARIEELGGGRGFADVAYIPKPASQRPAFVVELKWDKPADAALDQIRERGYPEVLRNLDVPVLLVGVTYDTKTKEHACRIEALDVD
ncbi:MAG: AAA family ATPase [Eggerthellaceae bacterium]|nr:AAA family ATPase [Eggerthellaceae bacterium]